MSGTRQEESVKLYETISAGRLRPWMCARDRASGRKLNQVRRGIFFFLPFSFRSRCSGLMAPADCSAISSRASLDPVTLVVRSLRPEAEIQPNGRLSPQTGRTNPMRRVRRELTVLCPGTPSGRSEDSEIQRPSASDILIPSDTSLKTSLRTFLQL